MRLCRQDDRQIGMRTCPLHWRDAGKLLSVCNTLFAFLGTRAPDVFAEANSTAHCCRRSTSEFRRGRFLDRRAVHKVRPIASQPIFCREFECPRRVAELDPSFCSLQSLLRAAHWPPGSTPRWKARTRLPRISPSLSNPCRQRPPRNVSTDRSRPPSAPSLRHARSAFVTSCPARCAVSCWSPVRSSRKAPSWSHWTSPSSRQS